MEMRPRITFGQGRRRALVRHVQEIDAGEAAKVAPETIADELPRRSILAGSFFASAISSATELAEFPD